MTAATAAVSVARTSKQLAVITFSLLLGLDSARVTRAKTVSMLNMPYSVQAMRQHALQPRAHASRRCLCATNANPYKAPTPPPIK